MSERRQMVADSDPPRDSNIPIPYVRKSSTVKQRNNEKQPHATGCVVHSRNLDTQAPQVGPFILGRRKRKGLLYRSLDRESNMVPRVETLRRSSLRLSLLL